MKLRFHKKKSDQRGLTLIEMVITIAIIGIFMTVVATFITSSSNMYRKVSTTAKLQSDMQTTVESIQNLLLDTDFNMIYKVNGQSAENDLDSTEATDRKLELYSTNEDTQTVEDELTYNSSEKKLYYRRWENGKSTEVLAEHVKNFTVDISAAKTDREVRFRLTLEDGGKELSQLCTVTLRNQLKQQ